jgi:hypothetical protein
MLIDASGTLQNDRDKWLCAFGRPSSAKEQPLKRRAPPEREKNKDGRSECRAAEHMAQAPSSLNAFKQDANLLHFRKPQIGYNFQICLHSATV